MSGTQKQSQSQQQGEPNGKTSIPGEDPGTLTDEDYLEAAEDSHPDSPVGSRRDRIVDPERSGGAEDHSNSM
jgi:hypothetical protein